MNCPTCNELLHAPRPARLGTIYVICPNGHEFYGHLVVVQGPQLFEVELLPLPEG